MTQEKLEKTSKKDDRKTDGKRRDKDHPPTKIVVRRLPPSLTPENFLEQVAPLPPYDFFYFVRADLSLGQHAFTRAYINFQTPEDVFSFRDKFDGYVFVDSKGNDFPAVVEFATFQKVPKKKAKKGDARKGTIEQDTDYRRFLESLQNPDPESSVSLDTYLEELEERDHQKKASNGNRLTTPLLDFLRRRREERKTAFLKIREERRRREVERRRVREDDRRQRKDPGDRDGTVRDVRDRGRDRPWEADRERERGPEKGADYKAGREKDLGDKTQGSFHQHQPVKLLKNTEREKEREAERNMPHEKDSFRSREERESKTSGRENLRFSKENRERERAEREKVNRGDRSGISDKGKPGSKTSAGMRVDRRSKNQQEEGYRRDEQHKQDDRLHPGYRDRDRRDKPKDGEHGGDHQEQAKDGDRDKNKKTERDKDYRGPRPGRHDREAEWSRDKRDKAQDRDRGREGAQRREKGPAGSGSLARREVGREGSWQGNGASGSNKREQGLAPRDRDRHRGESSVAGKVGEKVKQNEARGSPVLAAVGKDGEDSSRDLSQTRDSSTEREGNRTEAEDRRRKRKERPERQIYVPPKALERRQKQASKETMRDSGQGDTQGQSGRGEEQEVKDVSAVQDASPTLTCQDREKSSSERESEEQG